MAGAALSESVARRNHLRILSLFGTIDFDPSYDYEIERKINNRGQVRVTNPRAGCYPNVT